MKNYIAKMLLLLTLISCGQEPAKIDNSIVSKNDLLPTSESCSKVNFHKNVLLYKNTNNLFKCLDWDKEFPEVYKSITQLGPTQFNLLMKPANQLFFGSDEKRNKFLAFLNKNIRKDNVKSMEVLISALIKEYNVLDVITEVLEISSQMNIAAKILPSDKILSAVLETVNSIVVKAESERSKLSYSYQKAKQKNKNFENHLVSTINQAVTDALNSNGKNILTLAKFLGNGIWPKVMFSSIDESTYKELLYYPLSDKDIIYKAKTIKSIIADDRYNCSDISGVYYLDHSRELDARIEQFRTSNREEFVNSLFDLQLRYSLFTNICPYPELNYIIPSLLNHLASYVLIDGGFDIFKSITRTDETNNFVLFDFVSSKLFKKVYSTLELDNNSTKFLGSTYDLLKLFTIDNFKNISQTLNVISEDSESILIWEKLWGNLSNKNKKLLIRFLMNISLLPDDTSQSVSIMYKLNLEFSNFFQIYRESFVQYSSELNDIIKFTKTKLANKPYRNELSLFLSSERALKLITLFSSTKKETVLVENKAESFSEDEELLILSTNYSDSVSTKCLKEFHQLIQVEYDFWTVLDKYPKNCLSLNESKKTIAHKIFEWTFDLDSLYRERFNGKFSIPYGVISGEMMSFYHSILHLINDHIDTDDNYIREIINSIEKHLYEYGFLDILNKSLSLSSNILNTTDLAERVFDKLSMVNETEFDNGAKALLSLLRTSETLSTNPQINFSCDRINKVSGGEGCVAIKEVINLVTKLKDLLIRDNGTECLLNELIRLVHPNQYIKIPYDSKKQKKYTVELSELISFLYDATSIKTKVELSIFGNETNTKVQLNLVERLEVVIREISFLNNFYGAFFINKVAKAKKYTKNVKGMKKYVTIMDKTAGFFRNKKIFPESTKWAFKNIFNTYDSLWQVNNNFKQKDGSIKQYGNFIQSILAITVKSSSVESQKFTPFKKPDLKLVDNHNGKFLSLVAEHNLLSHLANLFKSNFESKEKLLNNKKFKNISKNFLKFTTAEELIKTFSVLLEHEHFELILKDTVNLFNKSSDKDILNIIDLFNVFSKNLNHYEMKNLSLITEVFMDSYKDIRLKFNAKTTISFVDIMTKSLVSLNDKDQKLIFKILNSLLNEINRKDFRKLINTANIVLLSDIVDRFVSYDARIDKSSNTLGQFLDDERLDFGAVYNLITNIKENDGNYDYLINIIKLMSEIDSSGQSNLEKGIQEILISNDKIIEIFLMDLFDRFTSTQRK